MKTVGLTLLAAAALLLPQTSATAGTALHSGSGNWSDATKWISTPAGFAPNNGNNGENWDATVNSGTATVNTAISIQTLTFGGGTINGASTLTVNTASSWSGGNMTGAGGVTEVNGPLVITPIGQRLSQRILNNNNAAVTVGIGTLLIRDGAIFNNTASGSFTTDNSDNLDYDAFGTTATFNNAGTFEKNGAGTVSFQGTLAFNNTGTVNVNAGTFYSRGGGVSTGTFNIASGASFHISDAAHTMNPGVRFLGEGFLVTGANTTFNGASTANTVDVMISGTTTFAAGASFATTGDVFLGGGTHTGAGTLTVGGTTTWGGGTMAGAGGITELNGPLAVSSGGGSITGRTLNSNGATTIGSTTIFIRDGGIFNNGAGATFTTNNISTLNLDGASTTGTFNNMGAFSKNGGGTASFRNGLVFNNTGTVNVNAGTLSLQSGYTQTGGVTILAGGAMSASAFNLNGGILAGTGNVTLGLNGDLTALNGAKLAPGNGVGTLALVLSSGGDFILTDAITASASGALLFELGATSDLLRVTGGPMHIGAGLLEFDDFAFTPLGGFVAGSYTLIDGDTPINGLLGASLAGMVGGFGATLALADGGRDLILKLAPVPEPGTALAGVALLGVALFRRRRRG